MINMDNRFLDNFFDTNLLDSLPDEWGIVIHCPDPRSIGFATTLAPTLIRQAIAKDIDLLVTITIPGILCWKNGRNPSNF